MTKLQWSRPMDEIPYPNVWVEFEARESKNSDKLVKYRIQDLTEDRFDDALLHMAENYLLDEPLSVICDGINDKEYVEDCMRAWRGALEQKVTLVCYREGSDEIVGLNVLIVNTRNDTYSSGIKQQSKSKPFIDMLKAAAILYKTFNPFDKYGVEKYLGSLGLSVDRKYRGIALGQRILEARSQLASPFGIKITQSDFSSDFANANADSAGFKLDVRVTFAELNNINPDFGFENVPSKEWTIKTLKF